MCVATARKASTSSSAENKQLWLKKVAQLKSQAVEEIDESFGYNKSIKIEAYQLLATASAELKEWEESFRFIDSALETAVLASKNTNTAGEKQSANLSVAQLHLECLEICVQSKDEQRVTDCVQQLLDTVVGNRTTSIGLLEAALELLKNKPAHKSSAERIAMVIELLSVRSKILKSP